MTPWLRAGRRAAAGSPDEDIALGSDHPATLSARHQIAFEIAGRGDHTAAEAEFRDVLAAMLRVPEVTWSR